MRKNFAKAMEHELHYEGGYANDPDDPGGVTLQGVTQRVYDGYRRRRGLQIRPLTKAMLGTAEWKRERGEIYRLQFANAIRFDDLAGGVDLVMLDGAINSGPAQATKWLQRALAAAGVYHGAPDGDLGESTLDAVRQHPDHDRLIADVLSRRLGMLQSLRTWWKFGDGWSKRIASVRAIGQAWAVGSIGPAPVEVASLGGNAKGYAGDVVMASYDPQQGTNAATGGLTIGTMMQGVQYTVVPELEKLSNGYGGSEIATWAGRVILGITVISALVAVGGAVASFFASTTNRAAQRAIDGDVLADLPELAFAPAGAAPKRKPRKRNRKSK